MVIILVIISDIHFVVEAHETGSVSTAYLVLFVKRNIGNICMVFSLSLYAYKDS